MRNSLLFLLKAALIALLLFACYQWLRPLYWKALFKAANLLFDNDSRFTLYYDSLDKIIPFIALLLATPKMPWLRKVVMLAIGLAVFMLFDVGAFLFSTPSDLQQTGVYNTPPDETYFWIWETYGRWLLPLILWVLTSHKYLHELFRLDLAGKAPAGDS